MADDFRPHPVRWGIYVDTFGKDAGAEPAGHEFCGHLWVYHDLDDALGELEMAAAAVSAHAGYGNVRRTSARRCTITGVSDGENGRWYAVRVARVYDDEIEALWGPGELDPCPR